MPIPQTEDADNIPEYIVGDGLFGVLTGKKLKIGVKGISIDKGGIAFAVFVLKSHGAKRVVGYLCEARIAAICALALQGYVQDLSVTVCSDFQSVLALVIGT